MDHVVDTERDFLAGHGLEPGDRPTGTPDTVWAAHHSRMSELLGAEDGAVLDTEFDGYFGPTTLGATLRDFYGFDLIVHRWDVGTALGREVRLSNAEMDHADASVAVFGAAIRSESVCGPAVPVSADSSRQDRLSGHLGRDPQAT